MSMSNLSKGKMLKCSFIIMMGNIFCASIQPLCPFCKEAFHYLKRLLNI